MHVGVTDARESQDARASRCSDASIQNETRAYSNVPFRFAIKISLRFPPYLVRPSRGGWKNIIDGEDGRERVDRSPARSALYSTRLARGVDPPRRADANGGQQILARQEFALAVGYFVHLLRYI